MASISSGPMLEIARSKPHELGAPRAQARGRVGIAVWAKGYGRDIDQVLTECLSQVGAKQPAYPTFGTRPDDLTGAFSEVGFVSIKSETRTLEITLSGGTTCGCNRTYAGLMF